MSRLTHGAAVLLGAVSGAAAVTIFAGHVGSNWGDLATWFGAVGTVGALSASAVQAGRATEQLELMRDEREDLLRQQARLIIVTTSLDPRAPSFVTFYVENRSDAPITALRLASAYLRNLGDNQPEGCTFYGMWKSQDASGVLAFHKDPFLSVESQNGGISLRPGESLAAEVMFLDAAGETITFTPNDHSIAPSLDVEFVDSKGVRWSKWQNLEPRRSANAAIHRDPPPAVPWK